MPTVELDTLEPGKTYLTSELTFSGLDQGQLRSIQPAVEKGLVDSLGVARVPMQRGSAPASRVTVLRAEPNRIYGMADGGAGLGGGSSFGFGSS